MSKADEMLYDLGFVKQETCVNEGIIAYVKRDEDGVEYGLIFYLETKEVGIEFLDITEYNNYIPTLEMNDLKAITAKIEELKWG